MAHQWNYALQMPHLRVVKNATASRRARRARACRIPSYTRCMRERILGRYAAVYQHLLFPEQPLQGVYLGGNGIFYGLARIVAQEGR